MKLSAKLLFTLLFLVMAGMLATNFVLKNEYDRIDKSNPYWTFEKMLEQPFRHLKIEGGNNNLVVFEPAPLASVRVDKKWIGPEEENVRAEVRNDTLFIRIPFKYDPDDARYRSGRQILARIFSPELLSIEGRNTALVMNKLDQASLDIRLSGKSTCTVESIRRSLDSVRIFQSDSTRLEFNMSPNIKGPKQMYIRSMSAEVMGNSRLDINRTEVGDIRLETSEKAVVELTGKVLKKYRDKVVD